MPKACEMLAERLERLEARDNQRAILVAALGEANYDLLTRVEAVEANQKFLYEALFILSCIASGARSSLEQHNAIVTICEELKERLK